ncbi:MAG: hypothetical protein GF418_00340 [Chitinivibrionales bacterium]|nr:hypothetical protein [Chitinivibrionales bacterium]MBD3394048.1 hypothetical protein [Chitinivibrionales bacterium]
MLTSEINAASLADAIERLLVSREARDIIRRTCRDTAVNHFDRTLQAQRYIDLYDAIAHG